MQVLGIDIGGSGIKGAPVDLERGELIAKRHRIPTPSSGDPEAVADVLRKIAEHFSWKGAIGCTFPGIIKRGVIHTAVNLDKSWVGTDARHLFSEATDCPVHVLNDADAAGIAEVTYGAGRGTLGVVIMLTFGTGIGSAMFASGHLVPNTEFGHLELWGGDAEKRASDRARTKEKLGWKQWSKRVNVYLNHLELLFSPNLFIIGGGVSNKADKFFKHLSTAAPLVAAELRNDAGIVGAALRAHLILDRDS